MAPISKQSTLFSFKAAMCLLLITFYVVGAFRFDAFHELVHPHDHVVTHSEEQEKDACHRAAYHGDKEGCGHRSHIIVTDKCELCDLIVHTDHIVLNISNSSFSPVVSAPGNISPLEVPGSELIIRSSRAPPALA